MRRAIQKGDIGLISQEDALRVLDAASASGADYAELFLEDTDGTHIGMRGTTVENAVYTRISGAGVRVFSGVRSAYAYAADTSLETLLETARLAAAAIQGHGGDRAVALTERRLAMGMQVPFAEVQNRRRIDVMREAAKAALGASDAVTQVMVNYLDRVERVCIASTDGVFAFDERPRTRLAVRAVAMRGGEAQTGHAGPGMRRGFEAYQFIDAAGAGKRAGDMAVTMLDAPECPAGVMPVVIDGGFGGVIFHEACGHSLEATSVGKGNSEFCGKLGQLVAAPCVTAVDDGTLPHKWGTLSIDDEGTPTRRNVLIENGVLKGYLIDKLGSRRMGMPPTGSSRRQSYLYAPTSRMTNTFICAGTDDEAEMIRTMGDGLFAKEMGGGSVNPATGEFNFAVSEGCLVRGGEIVSPVRGATLIGNGADILKRIDRVGPRMWMAQGMCGSASGSVPTNVGQPRIRVKEITVGGKGGVQ